MTTVVLAAGYILALLCVVAVITSELGLSADARSAFVYCLMYADLVDCQSAEAPN